MAPAIALGKFLHQGQIYMALYRIIVNADIYDTFVESFVAKTKKIQAGGWPFRRRLGY